MARQTGLEPIPFWLVFSSAGTSSACSASVRLLAVCSQPQTIRRAAAVVPSKGRCVRRAELRAVNQTSSPCGETENGRGLSGVGRLGLNIHSPREYISPQYWPFRMSSRRGRLTRSTRRSKSKCLAPQIRQLRGRSPERATGPPVPDDTASTFHKIVSPMAASRKLISGESQHAASRAKVVALK